ncbi:MAG: alcohol dehydrogenase catalytic domain-containing protein [Kiritimatiellaeota bacterium]|nr:alcohol dehydrogenase catalytic domain-containing protein [Kiritimatiellota bacterium]
MKAVVYHGQLDVRVEDIAVPVCAEGGLLVKVEACAVCGSDMKAYLSGNPRMKPPIVVGHEFSGVVVEARAEGFEVGGRVVMATSVSCGECAYCRRGWNNICANIRPMGFGYDGGMAEYVAIPELALRNGHVINVPAHVDPVHACLAEPVSCAVNACENSQVAEGDTVLVMGAGPMGILNALVARQYGASRIILSEVNPSRLAQGAAFGFNRLVNPAEEDLEAVVKGMTGGYGADVAIVAAPAAAPQEQALGLVRRRGTVCLFASLPHDKRMITVDSRLLHYGELRVVGTSDSTPSHVRRAVEILGGASFPAGKIVTHQLPLDGFNGAIELMKSGEALRVVLRNI